MSTHPFHGKVIVVTGASSGFGKGVALQFAGRGATLVLAARRGRLLDDLVLECRALGGRGLAVVADVSKSAEVERIAARAIEEFGRFDIWINNAGVGLIGRFEESPLADQVRVVETNLLGTMYGSYFAMRQFRRQQAGTLINVSSALGKIPAPYHAAYTAAKFGVAGLSAALRQEIRANKLDEIHVCTVLPMAADTPFFDHVANYSGREPRPIPPFYDPEQVIDAIVEVAGQPRDEVVVGTAGKLAVAAHGLAPGVIESLFGGQVHKQQIEQSTPANNTHGSVFEPTAVGPSVSGGRRKK